MGSLKDTSVTPPPPHPRLQAWNRQLSGPPTHPLPSGRWRPVMSVFAPPVTVTRGTRAPSLGQSSPHTHTRPLVVGFGGVPNPALVSFWAHVRADLCLVYLQDRVIFFPVNSDAEQRLFSCSSVSASSPRRAVPPGALRSWLLVAFTVDMKAKTRAKISSITHS